MNKTLNKIVPTELTLPPRTLIQRGAVTRLLKECTAFGKRGILVHGHSLAARGVLKTILAASPEGLKVEPWEHAGGEPTLFHVSDLLRTARAYNAEWVAGVGGGSVLDLAKTCAGLMHAQLKPVDYHSGAPIAPTRVPFIAVPTTAGTGSEATTVCVLTNAETGVKKSFRHPSFMARLVILDADLLSFCPPPVIASAGMDALTQAIESYTSVGATEFSDGLALKAIALIGSNLEAVYTDPRSEQADPLLLGSFLAGVALSNARLGIVHGLAHPLGARYHAPHGVACAVCLPIAIEFNREVIGGKYAIMSDTVGEDLLTFVRRLLTIFDIQSPFAGKTIVDRDALIREVLASGSAAANPRKVGAAEVERLLDSIFGSVDTPCLGQNRTSPGSQGDRG